MLLLDSIDPDEMCTHLLEAGLLCKGMVEMVRATSGGRYMRCDELLMLLMKRGPRAFDTFLSCLRRAKQDALVATLQQQQQEDASI
mgnify:CR=1 FL=1